MIKKISFPFLFFILFSSNGLALQAREKIFGTVPVAETSDDFQRAYDSKGTLFVLDNHLKQVRVYDVKTSTLLANVSWGEKLESLQENKKYFLKVDNVGNFLVYSIEGLCLIFDKKFNFVQKINIPLMYAFLPNMRFLMEFFIRI